MAYAIQREETVPAAVTRILDEQLLRARDQLVDPSSPPDKRVHDARKRFKEIRALVRLVRAPLGSQFDVENGWFRDAARDLAGTRDADAVIEALEKLAESKPLPPDVIRAARRSLRARRSRARPADRDGRITNVVDQIVVARARLGLWPALEDSFATIANGLLWSYRQGKRAMAVALDTRTDEDFHEWRKRVKEHWYHLLLLRSAWPSIMKSYAGELEELSRALGDHHDLVVLRERTAKWPELGEAIVARQRELEAAAEEIGRRVYSEKPRAWLARMRNYWAAWKTA